MATSPTDTVLVSFSSGEWNPRLDTRPDLRKAKSACRTLKNFRLAISGPAVKRPGLRFIAAVRVAPVPPPPVDSFNYWHVIDDQPNIHNNPTLSVFSP